MKSLEWTGPEFPTAFAAQNARRAACLAQEGETISEAMDRLHHEKHAMFRRWQDACVMNMIFGDNYVTTPEIPKGYEAYAKRWHDDELKAYK